MTKRLSMTGHAYVKGFRDGFGLGYVQGYGDGYEHGYSDALDANQPLFDVKAYEAELLERQLESFRETQRILKEQEDRRARDFQRRLAELAGQTYWEPL